MKLLCATGNADKFGVAKVILAQIGIELIQSFIDIDEIQGEDAETIIRAKALSAYNVLKKPVVVTDDSWDIPALGGFPGAYMKSMNHWFNPEDFIRLMSGIENRRVLLHQWVAYHDGNEIHTFYNAIKGEIVQEPRGSFGPPIMAIVALDHDNGLTISEVNEQGIVHNEERLNNSDDAWRQLGNYLKGKNV